MSRLFKALSLALAVVTLSILSIVAASCGSGGPQYRVYNALSNPNATFNFDVTINGSYVSPTGGMGFGTYQPGGGGYKGISSGSDTIEVYETGTTSPAFIDSALNLSGSTQYTVVLMGNTTLEPWVAQPFADNNTLPETGDIEFRLINAAPSLAFGTTGVDIYLLPSDTGIQPGQAPTFSSVTYGQPSGYATLPVGTYYLYVTESGSRTPLFPAYPYTPGSGSISTFVMTDNQPGNTWLYPVTLLTDVE